jgi:arylsulfatase A-like enzyme
MSTRRSVLIATGFALLAAVVSPSAEAARPNVVFLLADDLGWGDLSCHGSEFIQTPNIDRLAREGTDFQRFYTASPVCSPSRTGFMTGNFPARYSIRGAIGGVQKNVEWAQADWLDPKAVTLPRLLRDAGYVTGHFGKWHLQSGQADDAPLPGDYGVEEYALFDNTAHPKAVRTVDYTEMWDAAVDFLNAHKEQPFYVNIWMHETHLAHHPSEESLKQYAGLDEKQRIYAAVATDADRGVGRVLAALDELRLTENTLIVFSSDNGPENTHPSMKEMGGGYGGFYSVGATGGKKGRKRSLHDGGTNTAFFVRWPGHVPAGRVNTTTVLSATDLLPTVCAAAEVKLPGSYVGDGESMLAAWTGGEVARTKPIYWDWSGGDRPETNWARWAVLDGEWKLLTDGAGRSELYHMTADLPEAHDELARQPDVAKKLAAELDAWRASLPSTPAAEFLSRRRAEPAADVPDEEGERPRRRNRSTRDED